MLGVVLRPAFETRLRLHFLQTNNNFDNDLAWFALRNTVYASGCRIEMTRRDFSLPDIQRCSWNFFEKALSVHSELLFTATGLMAVEALAAMVFYLLCSLYSGANLFVLLELLCRRHCFSQH
jgi:hypothetical protein